MVLRLDDGTVHYNTAIDAAKAEHAFGAAGVALDAVARRLCASLAEHWMQGSLADWAPPFEGATIARHSKFTAQSSQAGMQMALDQHSSLHTLLGAYSIPDVKKPTGIVERVKQVVKRSVKDRHLAGRFSRAVPIGNEMLPLKVDFLGQHFACYIMQATQSDHGLEGNVERAYSKLYELDVLRRFVNQRRKSLGLLEDERPDTFELLIVGNRDHPVQRRAISQIEALVGRGKTVAMPVPDVAAAASHLALMERKAA